MLEVEVVDAATGDALSVRPDVRLLLPNGYSPAFPVPGSRTVHRSQEALEPRTWHVEVDAEGYATAKAEANVAPGRAATRIVVRMERAR